MADSAVVLFWPVSSGLKVLGAWWGFLTLTPPRSSITNEHEKALLERLV